MNHNECKEVCRNLVLAYLCITCHKNQKAHQVGAYPGFHGMKRLGISVHCRVSKIYLGLWIVHPPPLRASLILVANPDIETAFCSGRWDLSDNAAKGACASTPGVCCILKTLSRQQKANKDDSFITSTIFG